MLLVIGDKKVIAIIPARSGSKSIPDKNIRSLHGKPLMAYSIEHAKASRYIDRVIVSTDSSQYANTAKKYGAEAPFLRPPEISQDDSLDIELFQHALDWLKCNENYLPDICVHLRPTHPVRNIIDIDNMIELLINDPMADSIRSVIKNKTVIPYKMWFFDGDSKRLTPIISDSSLPEAYNTPRQYLPSTYFQNASVDIVRTHTLLHKGSMNGDVILGYVMDEEFDIDYDADFKRVEKHLVENEFKAGVSTGKRYCFDIDGVLASLTPGNNYSEASPIKENIELVNSLHDNGNTIILFTARGSATGIDWKNITENQMQTWGVKYHELMFGKPAADYYVDDRAVNIYDLKN